MESIGKRVPCFRLLIRAVFPALSGSWSNSRRHTFRTQATTRVSWKRVLTLKTSPTQKLSRSQSTVMSRFYNNYVNGFVKILMDKSLPISCLFIKEYPWSWSQSRDVARLYKFLNISKIHIKYCISIVQSILIFIAHVNFTDPAMKI